MGIFTKKTGNIDQLIAERERLAKEIIPILQEQVRNNPNDGKLHLEFVKALAMSGQLDEAKAESNAAMLKFPAALRQPVLNLQAEIDRLMERKRLGT